MEESFRIKGIKFPGTEYLKGLRSEQADLFYATRGSGD